MEAWYDKLVNDMMIECQRESSANLNEYILLSVPKPVSSPFSRPNWLGVGCWSGGKIPGMKRRMLFVSPGGRLRVQNGKKINRNERRQIKR